jgi:hypothetical protein
MELLLIPSCHMGPEEIMNSVERNDEKEERPNADVASLGLIFDPMEQMRELLFGAAKRETERQLSVIDGRLAEMRSEYLAHVETLESLLAELARETEKNRSDSILAIGSAISELGDRIKGMAANRKV